MANELKKGDAVKVDVNGELVDGILVGMEFNGDDGYNAEVKVNGVAEFHPLDEVFHADGTDIYLEEVANLLPNEEPREDQFRDDVEADADVLRSAGYGTDEDYGYYGGEEDY